MEDWFAAKKKTGNADDFEDFSVGGARLALIGGFISSNTALLEHIELAIIKFP